MPAVHGVDTGDVNNYQSDTFFQILETALFQRHFVGTQIWSSRFSCRMRGRKRSKWFAPYLPFPSCLLSGLETPDLAQEGFRTHVILGILGK